jgi:hypothetical protein
MLAQSEKKCCQNDSTIRKVIEKIKQCLIDLDHYYFILCTLKLHYCFKNENVEEKRKGKVKT